MHFAAPCQPGAAAAAWHGESTTPIRKGYAMSGMGAIGGGAMGGAMMGGGAMGASVAGPAAGGATAAGGHAAQTGAAPAQAPQQSSDTGEPTTALDKAYQQADQALAQTGMQDNPMLRFIIAMLLLEKMTGEDESGGKAQGGAGGAALLAMLSGAMDQTGSAGAGTQGAMRIDAAAATGAYGGGAAGAGGGAMGGGMSMTG